MTQNTIDKVALVKQYVNEGATLAKACKTAKLSIGTWYSAQKNGATTPTTVGGVHYDIPQEDLFLRHIYGKVDYNTFKVVASVCN